MSETEVRWRVKILHKDKKLDDMSRFCGKDGIMAQCIGDSLHCKKTNNPDKKLCEKCQCSVCNRSAQCCHTSLIGVK